MARKKIMKKNDQTKKSDGITEGYSNIIKNLKLDSIHPHFNADCLKCGCVVKEMLRVGSIVFCPECFNSEFHSEDPVHDEREKYLKWLKKSQEHDEYRRLPVDKE